MIRRVFWGRDWMRPHRADRAFHSVADLRRQDEARSTHQHFLLRAGQQFAAAIEKPAVSEA